MPLGLGPTAWIVPRTRPPTLERAATMASDSADGTVIDAGPAELIGGADLSSAPRITAGAGALT